MWLKNAIYKLQHWETWHYLGKYIPIMPVWIFYCLRARTPWFFTPSNPTLTFGGLEGESKKEMYDQLPPGTYPQSVYVEPGITLGELKSKIRDAGLTLPFAVKPDVGMMGLMFRRITNEEQLEHYHSRMDVTYIVQELVSYPIEVSVFYYRFPGQDKGRITGFLRKEHLEVTGDGVSTVRELIENYDRVRFRQQEMLSKHHAYLDEVVPAGEPYVLSYALNLSRGGRFVSLEKEIDDDLVAVFDRLSHYNSNFFYGRYDIKCTSVEDLKAGKNFAILEYNGCGAEPHHAYGNGYTLWQAYGIFLHHWKVLYRISRMNNKRGVKYWPLMKGYRYLKEARVHFKKLRQTDIETGNW